MKQRLKDELRFVFEAPDPQHKREFLRTLEQPRTGILAFVLSQLGYIRRWIWGVSVLVFAMAVLCAVWLQADMLWLVSALTPLLALTFVSESGRSENYGMAELEMATRFSLRSVLLARMGILGVENLVVLSLLLPLGMGGQETGVVQAGVYILTPYLLTAFAGLSVVRRFQGREAVYFCAGITVCICFLVMVLHGSILQLYQPDTFVWWIVCALLLCAGTAKQCAGIVRKREVQYLWSL